METVFIYGLWDPRSLELRYIGKSNNPKVRLKGHLVEAKSKPNKSYKDYWIAQLLREGLRPSLEILEEVSVDNWKESERAWIAEGRAKGLRLTNICEGGESGPVLTEEQERKRKEATIKALTGKKLTVEERRKLSEAHLGHKLTEETKKKLSDAHKGKNTWSKGRKLSPEHIEKKRIANKGRVFSEEHKRNISESKVGKRNPMYGKTHSEETRQKRSNALKGRVVTEEHRAKISASLKGHPVSQETIEKFRVKLKGRKMSEETRKRMSEGQKRKWEKIRNEKSAND